MIDEKAHHLNIIIDHLTDSIKNTWSGDSFATVVTAITKEDLRYVRKKSGEWNFNWKTEYRQKDRQVYKLTIRDLPDNIQGLVSVSDMTDHYYLHLAESAPFNLGDHKKYEGVGGNLFAFCCKLSWDNGNDGIIAFKSKTVLVDHYEKALGAFHIGHNNMIIYPKEALILINKYFKQ